MTQKQLIATLMEAVYACGQKGSSVFMTEKGITEMQRMMRENKILVVDLGVKSKKPKGWDFIDGGASLFEDHQPSAKIADSQR